MNNSTNEINNRGGVWDYIKSDVNRYYGKSDVFTVIKGYIKNRTIRWQIAFRMCQGGRIIRPIGVLLYYLSRNRYSIQIGRTTRIGYGLYIGHNGPVVVHPTAVIGDNVNLSQFVTIGSNHQHAAVIGNNTYIGPNVCIVENVIIGNNVTIGAGSVVTKDIPDNATAVGNYAKAINYDEPARYIKNPWGKDLIMDKKKD